MLKHSETIKLNTVRIRLQFPMPVNLVKHTFPWLHHFTKAQLQDTYCLTGTAPSEITIPREFLYTTLWLDLEITNIVPANKIELIDRICKAFRRNHFSYYQQYQFVWNKYAERSLFKLNLVDLEKILLELVVNQEA